MATKPTRIQSKQVYALINGIPTRRVQSFDWNSNFTVESVYELGNDGIVEDSVNLVETGITLNSNEWGTTDTEAMIFGIYEYRNVCKGTNTTATITVAGHGFEGNWMTAATVNSWLQVIKTCSHPTTNAAEYVKIADITYNSNRGCNYITLDPTYKLDVAATMKDFVTLVNAYTITEDTVDSAPVHIILPHRYSTSATAILHSVVLPRCFVDNLTYRIDTSGAAEQNYTLVGEEERLYLNSRREVCSIEGVFSEYKTSGSLYFTIPTHSMAIAGSPLICYADSNLATYNQFQASAAGTCKRCANMGAGLDLDANSQIIYYFTDKIKKGYKKITNLDNGIGRLTKGYVDVFLGTSTTPTYKLLRCTGIDISIPLARESIDELGEPRSIAKPLEGNLRQEITLTFSRNDLKEYAYLLDKDTEWNANTLKEILMTDLKAIKTGIIEIKLYNNQTTHNSTTLLKTFTFTSCNFIGDNSTTPISGAGGLEMTFSSETLSIVGSGNPPIYS